MTRIRALGLDQGWRQNRRHLIQCDAEDGTTPMDQTPAANLEARNLRERFALLLSGFSTFAARSQSDCRPHPTGIRTLLERFEEVRRRAEATEIAQATEDHDRIARLLAVYRDAEASDRRYQTQFADDFNLLEVLQLTDHERRHSMVLAWLLDRDLRGRGTHAQGSLGFWLFLEEFGLPLSYANSKYWVRLESAGHESIVDVEIGCRREFLIHIENKIWSEEGPDQTDREWADLHRRKAELDLSEKMVHALYLTPQGTKPKNANFKPVSWGSVANVFEQFADRAQPQDVRLFARHYAATLRRFIVTCDKTEDEDGQTVDE